MQEEAAAIKRLEYLPFGKEFKKKTSIAENQYQKTKQKTFNKYHNIKEFDNALLFKIKQFDRVQG